MKLQESLSILVQEQKIAPQYREDFLAMFGTREVENLDDVLQLYEHFCLQEETQQLQRNLHIEVTTKTTSNLATAELLQQIQNLCPQCKQKTRSLTQIEYLSCEGCSAPTPRPQYHIYSCTLCQYTETMRVSLQEMAGKEWCGVCQ